MNSDDTCCFCMEPISAFISVRLLCSHMYHVACLVHWKLNTCPYCRLPYTLQSNDQALVNLELIASEILLYLKQLSIKKRRRRRNSRRWQIDDDEYKR